MVCPNVLKRKTGNNGIWINQKFKLHVRRRRTGAAGWKRLPQKYATQGSARRRVGITRRTIFSMATHPGFCCVLPWLDSSELRQIRMGLHSTPKVDTPARASLSCIPERLAPRQQYLLACAASILSSWCCWCVGPDWHDEIRLIAAWCH